MIKEFDRVVLLKLPDNCYRLLGSFVDSMGQVRINYEDRKENYFEDQQITDDWGLFHYGVTSDKQFIGVFESRTAKMYVVYQTQFNSPFPSKTIIPLDSCIRVGLPDDFQALRSLSSSKTGVITCSYLDFDGELVVDHSLNEGIPLSLNNVYEEDQYLGTFTYKRASNFSTHSLIFSKIDKKVKPLENESVLLNI